MNRVVHFDVMAEEPERAMEFYTDVFGWEFELWEDGETEYWMITTGEDDEPGIGGGLSRRQGDPPETGGEANAFVCAVDVANVGAAIDDVEGAGGVVTTEVMDVGDFGKMAYCLDTEGNQFCLWQELQRASAN